MSALLPIVLLRRAIQGLELPGFCVVTLPENWNPEKPNFNGTFKNRDVYVFASSSQEEKVLASEVDKRGAAGVLLPRIPGKLSLEEYLTKYGIEAAADHVFGSADIWTPKGLVRPESVDDFLKHPFPDSQDIISRGILPERGKMQIQAQSKLGKSIFVDNMAVCIASGKPFLGQFEVPGRRRVVLFQQEIAPRVMQARMATIMSSALSFGFHPGKYLEIFNMVPMRLDTEEGLKTAMRIIRARQPEVVIWDPLYKLHGKDENKPAEMKLLLERFDYLRDVFGITQIIVHHHGKFSRDTVGRESFHLGRGASTFSDDADTILCLTRWKKTEDRRYQRLEFTLRAGAEIEDLVLYRNPSTLWYEVVEQADPDPRAKVTIANVVNALMNLGGKATKKDLYQKLTETTGAKARTIDNFVSKAVLEHRIRKEPVGREMIFSTLDSPSTFATSDVRNCEHDQTCEGSNG